MKKNKLNLITLSFMGVFFIVNNSFAINPDLNHQSVIRSKTERKTNNNGIEEMINVGGVNSQNEGSYSSSSIKYRTGNQDSQNIDGGWNCSNYIVHKEPIYIRGCPATDRDGNELGNSYKNDPQNLNKKEIVMRWVGLYKKIEQPNKFRQTKYQTNGNRETENYLGNNLNKFRIPQECKWTGINNSYKYYDNSYIYTDSETKSKYFYYSSYNSGRNDSYYKKPSTDVMHQILKVDELRDATGNYEKCYPKCGKIEELLQKNGDYQITDTLKCVRGEGVYLKRSKISYQLPSHMYQTRTNIVFIKPEECEAQKPALLRELGIHDVNNCKNNVKDSNSFFTYKDDVHYSSLDRAEQLLGMKIPKNKTDRILKVIINGEAAATNIMSKKYINSQEGSQLNAIYNQLFDYDNIEDITEFKIVLTKEGMDEVVQNKKQKIFGYEIHDFYEKSFKKKVDYCKNPDPNLYTIPINCNNKQLEENVYNMNNDYENNMFVGVLLHNKSDLDPNGFSIRTIKDLNDELAITPVSAFVFQKDLNNRCERIGVGYNNSYFTNQDKGKAYLQCEDIVSKLKENPPFTFYYNTINWNDTVKEIDITEYVKLGKVPHIYYINNDNNQKGKFAVKFVISYKQTPETENAIPNQDFEW